MRGNPSFGMDRYGNCHIRGKGNRFRFWALDIPHDLALDCLISTQELPDRRAAHDALELPRGHQGSERGGKIGVGSPVHMGYRRRYFRTSRNPSAPFVQAGEREINTRLRPS